MTDLQHLIDRLHDEREEAIEMARANTGWVEKKYEGKVAAYDEVLELVAEEFDVDVGHDEKTVLPDGGSKYVRETGEGYCGIYNVRSSTTELGIFTMPVDWDAGDPIYAHPLPDGVRLDRDDTEPLLEERPLPIRDGNSGPRLTLRASINDYLGVADGQDVRVYEAEGDGLLVVPAHDDPRVMTDGGRDVLDEVGPYEDDDLPFMNFECPDCGFAICEWTDCPDCGWYDVEVWEATMANYTDCRECGQTIGGGTLCDDCDKAEVLTDGGRDIEHRGPHATPDGSRHYCHICETGFDDLTELVEHECPPPVETDGGRVVRTRRRIDPRPFWACSGCERDRISSTVNPGRCPRCGTVRPGEERDRR